MRNRPLHALLRTLLILTFLGIATAAMAQRTEPGLMGQGTEDRDWIDGQLPDPTSPVRYTYQTYEHVKIPMRDGVHLDALVYIPHVPEPGPRAEERRVWAAAGLGT